MNQPPDASQTLTDSDSPFDPNQAAALLEQITQRARRDFTPLSAWLFVYRAFLALVAFGGFWLSVRGQHPYSGPRGWSLPVAFVLVAINIVWTTLAIRRAGTGVSGPAQRKRQAWLGVMLVVWIVAYGITAPLYHAGVSHPVWGLYPASAPLMIIGVAGAVTAAVLRDRPLVGVTLAVGIVGTVAGFGGPVGSWLIMGIGLCLACLGIAASIAWWQHRSVVRL
jgi:uncharacterized membrane protein (DUF485 family)